MKQEPLATRYDPASFEQKWYAEWESKGYFTPEAKTDLPAFSIVIPPPNVTGRLHNGHALVNTLIDVQTRWKRMRRPPITAGPAKPAPTLFFHTTRGPDEPHDSASAGPR